MRRFALAATLVSLASAGVAQEVITRPFNGTFEDATFAVESAITDQGLVIDFVSHVGDMLNRTGEDVGSDATIFDAADIFIFCSATVSRSVMEADPMNVAFCPYGIFVTQNGGAVQIGYRTYPAGPMQEVQALLESIVSDAAGE